ncbi:MAG: hypothetical protein JKY34_06095 [Kordiimonadaceae bacterium]|nr:hypothetical protein [Kordiimonadaceae bacterium]
MTEDPAAAGDGAAAQGGEEASSGGGVSKISGALTAAASSIAPVIDMLKAAGMAPAAQAVEVLVNGLTGGAAKLQETIDGVANAEGGIIGQVLGGAEALLSGVSGGEEGEDGEGGFLEKAREKVSALKSIWDKYHADLFDKEGKLNKGKLANMALEVGSTLLGAKKMAKIKKAYAIGSVIVDTAKGITKTFSELGFPAAIGPAAALAVAGAKQLAVIKGQAHDGLTNVPSTGTYLLEKGERVVGSRLNSDLQGFLSAQNGGAGDTNVATNSNSVTNSPTINFTVNGDADGSAIENNRASMESMIRDVFADHAKEAPFG